MKQLFILLLFMVIISVTHAQCKSGNCTNGTGKMDYGWCVYEGAFVNGKAEGTGTMKYDDYTYTGNFKNGMENGDGTIVYKDGRKENVHYVNGEKVQGPTKLAVGEYKPLNPQDPNCISGNCINGYGTYVWPSGNKYTGNWKNYKREGQGDAFCANGDKFTGTWHNNEKAEGSYSFSNGAVYTGTYDADGNELNGQVALGSNVIPFVNGVAKIPPAPVIVYTKSENGGQGGGNANINKSICSICNGSGKIHHTIEGGGISTDRYGNRTTVFGEYESCIACGGSGYR